MLLYHGTLLESGEKIIQEGKIRCQIKRKSMKDMRILLKVRQMDLCI